MAAVMTITVNAQTGTAVGNLNLVNQEINHLVRNARGAAASMQGLAQSFIATGYLMSRAITEPIERLAKMGFAFNSMKEQALVAFTVMMGSATEAQKHLNQLFELAAKSPFRFEQVITGSKQLQAMGVAAQDVIPVLVAVGDAASAMGKPELIDRLTYAMGKLQAQGKLTAREILMFAQGGVNVRAILMEQLGVSLDEVTKKIRAGQITADYALKAIVKGIESSKIAGMMDIQAKTFSGRIATMLDELDITLGQMTEGLYAQAKRGLELIIPFITQFRQVWAEMTPGAQQATLAIAGIAAVMGPLMVVVGALLPIVASLGWEFFAVSAAIIAAVAAIVTVVVTDFGGIKTIFLDTVRIIQDSVGGGFGGLAAIAESALGSLRDTVEPIVRNIAVAVREVVIELINFWAQYGPGITEGVRQVVTSVFNIVKAVGKVVGPIITGVIGEIRQAVAEILLWWGERGPSLLRDVSVIFNTIAAFLSYWAPLIYHIIEPWIAQVILVIKSVILIVSEVVRFVAAFIDNDWATAWDSFKSIVQIAGQFIILTIWNAVKYILAAVGFMVIGLLKLIWWIVKTVLSLGWAIIKGIVVGIWEGAKELWQAVKDVIWGSSDAGTQAAQDAGKKAGETWRQGYQSGLAGETVTLASGEVVQMKKFVPKGAPSPEEQKAQQAASISRMQLTPEEMAKTAEQAGEIAAMPTPGMGGKKGRHQETELERLTKDIRKLRGEIDSFTQTTSAEFTLRFKAEGLKDFKQSLENIVGLRRELGLPIAAKLPTDSEAARHEMERMQGIKRVYDSVKTVIDERRDAAEKLAAVTREQTIPVIDSETRYQTAYLQSLRDRRNEEQQTTADLKLATQQREDSLAAEAESLRDTRNEYTKFRTEAIKNLETSRLGLIREQIRAATQNPELEAQLQQKLEVAMQEHPDKLVTPVESIRGDVAEILKALQATRQPVGTTTPETMTTAGVFVGGATGRAPSRRAAEVLGSVLNPSKFDAELRKVAEKSGYDPELAFYLLKATLYRESSGVAGQTSSQGAKGLFGFLPGTAGSLGARNLNTVAGAGPAALKYLMQGFERGGAAEAFAGFFAGPGGGNRGVKTAAYARDQSWVLANALAAGQSGRHPAEAARPGAGTGFDLSSAALSRGRWSGLPGQSGGVADIETVTVETITAATRAAGLLDATFSTEANRLRLKSVNDLSDHIKQLKAEEIAEGDAATQAAYEELRLSDDRITRDTARRNARKDMAREIRLIEDDLRDLETRNAQYLSDLYLKHDHDRAASRRDTLNELATAEEELRRRQGGDRSYDTDAVTRARLDKVNEGNKVKDEIAQLNYLITAEDDASDRYRLAWLKAYQAVQDADEEAVKQQIEASVKIADSMTLHMEQVRGAVLKHISEQKSLSDTVADSINSIYDRITGRIDTTIDRWTKKLGFMGGILGDIFKTIEHGLVSKVFAGLFTGEAAQQAAAAGQTGLSEQIPGGGTSALGRVAGLFGLNLGGAEGGVQTVKTQQMLVQASSVTVYGGGAGGNLPGLGGGAAGGLLALLTGGLGGGIGARGGAAGGGAVSPQLAHFANFLAGARQGGAMAAGIPGGAGMGGGFPGLFSALATPGIGSVINQGMTLQPGGATGQTIANAFAALTGTKAPNVGGLTAAAKKKGGLLSQLFGQGGPLAGLGSFFGQKGGGGLLANQGFGFGTSQFAQMLPLLGMGLGGQLGQGSALGSIMGSAGGLLAGVGLMAPTGIFAAGGSLGFLAPLFSNPITAIVGGALLVGAIILSKNAKRKKDEKTRAAMLTQGEAGLRDILKRVQNDTMDGQDAITQALAIRADYMTAAAGISDRKTRQHAEQDVNRLDIIISQIRVEAQKQQNRKDYVQKFVPTYGEGGLANDYRALIPGYGAGGLSDVSGAGRLPGVYQGRDTMVVGIAPGETVLTPSDVMALGGPARMREIGVKGYATNGRVAPAAGGGGGFQAGNSNGQPIVVVFVGSQAEAEALVNKVPNSTIAAKVRKHVAETGPSGLVGDIAAVLETF